VSTLRSPPIRHLRYYVIFLFFFASIISYIDRQTLSVNASHIRNEMGLSNSQYGYLVTAFLIAYTIGPTLAGRLMDVVGTRIVMSACMIWWSLAGMLHAAPAGFAGLLFFRFLLGLGEAGTLPGAVRVASEWFPQRERSLATSIFSAGTALGALVSVPIVAAVTLAVGWRTCFIVTGLLGFVWLAPWLAIYRRPEDHPRIDPSEREMILAGRVVTGASERPSIRAILSCRKPWGIIVGRMMVDPVWWFYVFWLPTYLVDVRGFSLKAVAMFGWIPFLATDAGSLTGGLVSRRLLARMDLTEARKRVLLAGALGMLLGIPAPFVSQTWLCLALISSVAFAVGLWAPTVLSLCADILPTRAVGTMSGLSGTGAGIAGVLFTTLTGWLVDNVSYVPVFLLAAILPPLGFVFLSRIMGTIEPIELEEPAAS
jgi:MFS transporter, ACS family, hexuronate transporter